MFKSESFDIEVSLPAVDAGEKILKRIYKVLPKGSTVKVKASKVLYKDVKAEFGKARPKEEGAITINR